MKSFFRFSFASLFLRARVAMAIDCDNIILYTPSAFSGQPVP